MLGLKSKKNPAIKPEIKAPFLLSIATQVIVTARKMENPPIRK
jgi:hypothetical protein